MSRYSVRAVLMAVLITSAIAAAPVLRLNPPLSPETLRKELDAAWEDLESSDELTAGRALLLLASRPDDTVRYVKERLRPLKLKKDRAYFLIADLGGNDEKAARAAFDEFRDFDPRLALDREELEEAMVDRPASRRLGAILCDLPMDALSAGGWHFHSPDNVVYHFTHGGVARDVSITVGLIGRFGRKATWDRACRAVAALEFIATPQAKAVLADMATGHPDAAPTKAARVALDRLAK